MAKILVVEDSPVQIEWAKKVLAGHEVVICQSWAEFTERRGENFELVLTDLCIPRKNGDDPTEMGSEIFFQAKQSYFEGKIGGTALVSNYEHHNEQNGEALGGVSRDFLGFYGTRCVEYAKKPEFKRSKNSLNILVVLDGLTWWSYDHLLADGRIVPGNEISDSKNWELLEGAVRLKPWKEVVDFLLEGTR